LPLFFHPLLLLSYLCTFLMRLPSFSTLLFSYRDSVRATSTMGFTLTTISALSFDDDARQMRRMAFSFCRLCGINRPRLLYPLFSDLPLFSPLFFFFLPFWSVISNSNSAFRLPHHRFYPFFRCRCAGVRSPILQVAVLSTSKMGVRSDMNSSLELPPIT